MHAYANGEVIFDKVLRVTPDAAVPEGQREFGGYSLEILPTGRRWTLVNLRVIDSGRRLLLRGSGDDIIFERMPGSDGGFLPPTR